MPLSTLLRQTGLTSGAAWVLAEGTAATRARRETEEHARARETVEQKLKREAEERAIWEELAKKTEVEKTELIARREAPPARADQTYPSLEIVGPLRAFAEAQQYFGLSGEQRTHGGRGRHAAHDPIHLAFPIYTPACSFENAPVGPLA